MKKSLWDGDLADYEREKSQLMRNKFSKINKLNCILEGDYEMEVSCSASDRPHKARRGEKGGEPVCKPGSVEDSHSSTTTIAGRL